jgi:hypothetical protein
MCHLLYSYTVEVQQKIIEDLQTTHNRASPKLTHLALLGTLVEINFSKRRLSVSSNNKEFQAYLDTFDEPSKHRELLWDAWVEATRVVEEKFTSTKTGSPKFCLSCEPDAVLRRGMDKKGFLYCPWCGAKLRAGA